MKNSNPKLRVRRILQFAVTAMCAAAMTMACNQTATPLGDQATEAEEGSAAVIEDGSKVSIEYTLKLEDGTTADTNVGGEALTYEQGGSQILPALETELMGLTVGDTKIVKLSAEQAYGQVDPNAVQEVELDQVPEEARKEGTILVAHDQGGNRRPVRVQEVRDEKIVLDFNHPLAGQALAFDVKIVGIE